MKLMMSHALAFPAAVAAALSASTLFASGTEFGTRDMYTLAPDGSRRPLAAAQVKDGFAVIPRNTPFHVEMKGIEPGEYYVSVRARFDIPDASVCNFIRNSELYVNGRRVNYIRARIPEEGGAAEWLEHDKVALRNGDIVTLTGRFGEKVSDVVLTKERLSGDIVSRYDEPSDRETYIADLDGCALAPDGLSVSVKNMTGRAQDGTLSVRVTDYWGNEVFASDEQATLGGAFERRFAFPANATGETRATVVWRQADGLFARKYLASSHDVLSGVRKRIVFESGWKWCARYDDGIYDSRRVRDDVPEDAQWKATSIPAFVGNDARGRKPTTAYFRNSLVVPGEFGGSRVVFSAERARTRARLFVNGRFVRETADEEFGQPFEADITDFLKSGENDVLLVVHGWFAAFRDSDLRTVKNLDRSLEYLPSLRGGISLCEVRVKALPKTHMPVAPFITTSVAKKTVMVRTRRIPAGCTVSHRVLYKGRQILGGIKDGAETPFADAPLWGPLEFPLLQLETTLKDVKGKAVDVLSTRFGFREFSARGGDLLWNGRPFRSISRAMANFTCLDGRAGGSRQKILDDVNLMKLEDSRIITHTASTPHFLFDVCDELGIAATYQTDFCPGGQMEARFAADNTRYWAAKRKCALAAVDNYGRHPSIFNWQVCGEFWTLNDDRAYNLIAPCMEELMEYDPTRFAEAESDADCRGLTAISSTHYPIESAFKAPELWYPNLFYFRPLGVDFADGMAIPCGQLKTIGNCHGDSLLRYNFKPIFANEAGWSVNIGRPHASTRLFGDDGYHGFNTLEGHHAAVNRETYYGQRDAGFVHIGDWRNLYRDRLDDIAPNFDVQPVERYHAFYEETEVSYQVNVFHDVMKAETLDFTWRLVGADGRVAAAGKEKMAFDFCKGAKTRIRFAAPREGRYTLRFGVEGRLMRELPVETYARRGDEDGLLKNPRIVAGDAPVTAEMLAKVEKGGVLFLLPREEYPAELPVKLQPTSRNASLCMTFRPGHPLLEGLSESDLSLWFPNHVCGFGFFDKPASGMAKTVVEAGGRNGLVYSALVEIPYGRGTIYASRLELKPDVNPIAAKILRNAASVKPSRPGGPLGVVGGAFLKQLKAWSVEFEQVDAKSLADGSCRASDFAALFVDGGDKAAADLLKDGNSAWPLVFVQNPDPALWGVKVNSDLPKKFNGSAIKLTKTPKFLAGLTNTDFFWRKIGLGWIGENPAAISDKTLMLDPLGTAEIWGEEALLYPRHLAARGNVLFSCMNLAPSNLVSQKLAERIVTTIFANAGVGIAPRRPVIMPKRFRYEPVDISKLLHRSFEDDVDNDGNGGWADLGPQQDLREFKLPAGVHCLGGVDYRIERPKSIFTMKSKYRKEGDTLTDAVVELGGKKAPWIFFLHSCVWEMALQTVSIFVDYSDGKTYEIAMSGGVNIRDYASRNPDLPFIGEVDTVTKCAVTVPHVKWGKGSMFSTGWCNPNPDKPIARLRFHSLDRSAVMFAAVTLGYPLDDAAGGAAIDERACKEFAARAERLQKAKKYREAIAVYEKAHEADPRQLFVMNAIGNCHDRLGEYKKAVEWYHKSLDTDMNQPHVHDYLNAAKRNAETLK